MEAQLKFAIMNYNYPINRQNTIQYKVRENTDTYLQTDLGGYGTTALLLLLLANSSLILTPNPQKFSTTGFPRTGHALYRQNRDACLARSGTSPAQGNQSTQDPGNQTTDTIAS